MRFNRAARRAVDKRGGKIVELTMVERLLLNLALPQQGNYATVRTIDELRRQLLPSEAEAVELEETEKETGRKWELKDNRTVEIAIGPLGDKMLRAALKALDEQGTLTTDHLTLWQKFMGDGELEASPQ